MTKMKVNLTFHLDEEVTPEIFCLRVATACSKGGAIRPGESVGTINDSVRYKVIEAESVDVGLPFEVGNYVRPM